jgi:hypothetical protein
MDRFERLGHKLDRELDLLRDVAERKLSPTTRVKAVKALRSVSGGLTRLAAELESKSLPKEP